MTDKPTHTPGTLTLDARTIGLAILFLVGGGATGAGTSMLGGSGVQEQVKSLSDEVRTLTRSVDVLVAEARSAERDQATLRSVDSDHELRIRKLEGSR